MPECPNWWHNEIGVPKKMAGVLLMMREELSEEEMAGGLKVLERSQFGRTGQNKVWLAGNNLMKGLLTDDEALVRRACREIQETIYMADGEEGIQKDWSFHQHGPQIQFGNYGLAYVEGLSFWMSVLKGTSYDFSAGQKEMVSNLIKNAFVHSPVGDTIEIAILQGRLSVSNSGDEALDGARLFDRFYTSGKTGSTGLGLALVKSISGYYDFGLGYIYRNGKHNFYIKF